jgi:hypothetical protein
MVKLHMLKSYFHNSKSITENKSQKKSTQTQYINQKINVDINILLNRIRIEEKNETKKKIIFYSLTILALGFFSTIVMTIN